MRFLHFELALGLFLAGCGGDSGAVLAGAPLGPLATFPLEASPGRTLRSYAWEGAGAVPALDADLAGVPFGELGVTPATRLYLRTGRPLDQAGAVAWQVEREEQVETSVGRFGEGLRLARSSRLVLAAPAPLESEEGAWSIQLWLRPEELRAGTILTLDDVLEIFTEESGRVLAQARVTTPDGPRKPQAKSKAPLVAGEWNHLGVVLDAGSLKHLRIVLNGSAHSEPLQGAAPTSFTRFTLGAGGGRKALPGSVDEVHLQDRPANTAEFEARWRCAPSALERLTLDHGDGREVRELWTRALEVPRLEAGSDWSVGDLRHVRADGEGLSWTPADWQRVPALDPPLARTTAPVVDVGDEKLFVFSGEVRDSHYGRMTNVPDTWLFDQRTGSWEQVETPVAPPGRCHQPAAYSPDHDVVLMAGGWVNERNPGVLLSDLWLFHVKERRWEERTPPGLTALSDCVVVYHPGRKVFVILAGLWIYTYDPARDAYEAIGKVRPRGSKAPETLPNGPIAALDPRTNLLWIFGGAYKQGTEEEFSDDLASLDLETLVLTYHEVPRPSARVRSAFTWDPEHQRFVLFGGVREQKSQRFDDLWTFEPDALRWQQVPYAGAITRRGGYYGMGYSPEQRRFFLLTGRHALERFLEESWTLALDERAEGRARYLFDRAAFPEEAAWMLEAEAGDGRVEARFRASDDGRTFGPVLASCPPKGRYVEVDLRLAPGPSGVAPRVRALGFRAPQ